MTLIKAIEQVLSSKTCTTVDEFTQQVQSLLKKPKPERTIQAELIDYVYNLNAPDIVIDVEAETIVYRDKLFENAAFRLEIFEEELEGGYLITPGRFIPFFHSMPPKTKLHFEDEKGEVLPIIQKTLSLSKSAALAESLQHLPPYADVNFKVNFRTTEVTIPVVDLTKWLKENPLTIKNQLLITTLDYEKRRFRIQRISTKDISSAKLITKSADNELEKMLVEFVEYAGDPVPLDYSLFWVYAFMPEKDYPILKKPGSPVSLFINNLTELELFTQGEFSFVHVSGYMEAYWDELMFDTVHDTPLGTAVELSDILFEMGSTGSKGYFAGKMVQQLQNNDTYDLTAITDKVFSYSPFVFANDRQQENYEKAIKKLEKEIAKRWTNNKMSLPVSQALNKALNAKEAIMSFVQAALQHQTDDMDHAMSILYQIKQIDFLTDQILENIALGSKISPDEAKDLTDQINFIKRSFDDFESVFFEGY